MRRSAAVALFIIVVPAAAAAQVGPGATPVESVPAIPVAPSTTPAATTSPETAPVLVGLARRSAEDAASDRAFAAPTAVVAPKGTVTFTVRAPLAPLVNAQVSYALSDRFEVGIGTVWIGDSGSDEGVMSGHAKLQLARGRRAALAASVDLYRSSDPGDEGHLLVPSLVASLCTDGDACRNLLSFHLTAATVDGEDKMPVLPGVSLAMGGKRQLLLEAHMYSDQDSGDGFVVGYAGVRWTKAKLALDAGLGFYADTSREVYYDSGCIDYCGDSSSNRDVVPWPFVGLSSRM